MPPLASAFLSRVSLASLSEAKARDSIAALRTLKYVDLAIRTRCFMSFSYKLLNLFSICPNHFWNWTKLFIVVQSSFESIFPKISQAYHGPWFLVKSDTFPRCHDLMVRRLSLSIYPCCAHSHTSSLQVSRRSDKVDTKTLRNIKRCTQHFETHYLLPLFPFSNLSKPFLSAVSCLQITKLYDLFIMM